MITLPLNTMYLLINTFPNSEVIAYSVNKYYSFFSFLSAYVIYKQEGEILICLVDMRVCQLVGTYSLDNTFNTSGYNFPLSSMFEFSIRFHEDTLLLQVIPKVIFFKPSNERVIPLRAFTLLSKSYEDYFNTFLSDYSFYLRILHALIPKDDYVASLVSYTHVKDKLQTVLLNSINSIPPL